MGKCTRHHLFSYGGLLEAVKIKFISVLLRSIYVLGKLKAGKNHFLSIRTSVYLVLSAGLSISQFFYISLPIFGVWWLRGLQNTYYPCMVLKIGEYPWILPSFSWGIFSRDMFRAIACEQNYLMDYNRRFITDI